MYIFKHKLKKLDIQKELLESDLKNILHFYFSNSKYQ